jgi:hypothetical protein
MRKRSETKRGEVFPMWIPPIPSPPWRGFVEQNRRGKGRDWAGSCRKLLCKGGGHDAPGWAALRLILHKESGTPARPRSLLGIPVASCGWNDNVQGLGFTLISPNRDLYRA